MQLQVIQKRIYEIRGHNVMLDYDLAEMYETSTRILKQSVRRNMDRFPDDFMFELSNQEFMSLRSQIVTSKKGGTRYKPYAFTEQGVAMLSSVLNSPKAIEIKLQIIRAFVFLRQYALTHKDLTEKLKEPEGQFHKKFKDVYEAINYLLKKIR